MARDDQGNRILGHGLPDITSGFGSGGEFLCESAIRRRLAPADAARCGVGLLEKVRLLVKVEQEFTKVGLLTLEISSSPRRLHRATRSLGAPGCGERQPTQQTLLGCFGASRRQLESCDTRLAPGDTAETVGRFEDLIAVCRCAQ